MFKEHGTAVSNVKYYRTKYIRILLLYSKGMGESEKRGKNYI